MTSSIRFHLSLNVTDLARSVEFFTMLLGAEPAKRRADYAKFEPPDVPIVLSLEPTPPRPGVGPLNHVGLRMPDAASLVATQERLERAGVRTCREEGVECCYARQTKFWLHDPDGTLWEVYTLDADIDHRGSGQTDDAVRTGCGPSPSSADGGATKPIWEHRLGDPLPARIPLADAAVAEVHLRGTFNAAAPEVEKESLVSEARRILRPGGRLFVHVLVGDRAVAAPQLGGPAAVVQFVPHRDGPPAVVERAGFRDIALLKFDAHPCFTADGVAMREMQLEAFTPTAAGA
jgi:catechol 2,3-dioxygenase-like lactoylglutathione lyase family enzyme